MTQPLQPYPQPAVALRATWSATDGSRPETVELEWKDHPGTEEITTLTRLLQGHGGVVDVYAFPETAPAPRLPGSECLAEGPGHELADEHGCELTLGHEPVEPDGRNHRCQCGGLFSANAEIPDVPGRAARDRDRRKAER